MRLLLFLALLVTAARAHAQDPAEMPEESPAALQEAEEVAVLAAVGELWDAMRAGDSTRVRAVFHPDARFYSVAQREGETRLVPGDVEAFVTAVGTPHDEVWDERVWDEEVRVDGGFATYWTAYAFYLGDRRSHCGIDAFDLVRTGTGWQILNLVDTRRACAEEE